MKIGFWILGVIAAFIIIFLIVKQILFIRKKQIKALDEQKYILEVEIIKLQGQVQDLKEMRKCLDVELIKAQRELQDLREMDKHPDEEENNERRTNNLFNETNGQV